MSFKKVKEKKKANSDESSKLGLISQIVTH